MDSLTTVQIPLAQAVQYGNCVEAVYTVYQSTGLMAGFFIRLILY